MDLPSKNPCILFDLSKFKESGAIAFSLSRDGLVLETARGETGVRLWNTPQLRQLDPPDISTVVATLPEDILGTKLGDAPARHYAQAP